MGTKVIVTSIEFCRRTCGEYYARYGCYLKDCANQVRIEDDKETNAISLVEESYDEQI